MKSIVIPSHVVATKLHTIDLEPVCEFIVEDSAQLTLILVSLGKKSVDATSQIRLVGAHAHAKIIGVFLNSGDQDVKLHTLQRHEAPNTTSNLLVKTILTDTSHFSYDGAIRVEKEGQKTDAYQRNENLLLSSHCHAQSKPSLEILADDVRCTHGATIGTVDKEQLFYLSTRGIGEIMGKQLIIHGFLESAIGEISDTIMAEKVRKLTWQHLPQSR